MIVKYDEENFSIKLYRDFVKGKLVGLMEVIPIDELLEVWADRKTEPTHDLRTKTHECVKDTHDKTSPNSSEKPNNSTISKMEQVEDEPLTCSFSDCDNFKNPDYARCIECKRKQIELKTEPNSSEIPTGSTTEDCSVVEERSSE